MEGANKSNFRVIGALLITSWCIVAGIALVRVPEMKEMLAWFGIGWIFADGLRELIWELIRKE